MSLASPLLHDAAKLHDVAIAIKHCLLHGEAMSDDDDSTALTRDIAPFGLRMPPMLKERIRRAARENGRSMNAEIIDTLEREYPENPYTAEEFVQYLQSLSEPMDLDAKIGHTELLNQTLRALGVDLEAQLESGDIILMRRSSAN